MALRYIIIDLEERDLWNICDQNIAVETSYLTTGNR